MASALQLVRRYVQQVRTIPNIVAHRAGARIQQRLREDATTKRGNVPSFGDHGDVPIAVEVRAKEIHVNGPDWVLKKAQQKGQIEEWRDIVADETQLLIAKGIR